MFKMGSFYYMAPPLAAKSTTFNEKSELISVCELNSMLHSGLASRKSVPVIKQFDYRNKKVHIKFGKKNRRRNNEKANW